MNASAVARLLAAGITSEVQKPSFRLPRVAEDGDVPPGRLPPADARTFVGWGPVWALRGTAICTYRLEHGIV